MFILRHALPGLWSNPQGQLERLMIKDFLNRCFFCLATLTLVLGASTALSQWQKIAPPIEMRSVPSDGSRVAFNFTLPNGMQYWVRTSGTVVMSSGGDIADGHYYNTTPTSFGYTGFMVRSAGTDALLQIVSPQLYRGDHIYSDPISSAGGPLSFRLSDENPLKPQTNYYLDNVGSLTVEVAQWTPELIIQYDTLDFGKISVGSSVTLIDSIQAYGKENLVINDVYIQAITGGNAFSYTSERGRAFSFSETTNEFKVTAAPTVRGPLKAALHLLTPNAYGMKDRVIILLAEVEGADVIMVGNNDTLDFGTTAAGSTVSRGRAFYNAGDLATQISGVTISMPNVFQATTPVQLPVKTQANLNFQFTPPAQGDYLATADVQYASGGSKRMYLKGRAGVGKPSLSTRFIDFGRVLIGDDSIVTDLVLGNTGDVEYMLTNITIDNPQFSFIGFSQNVKVGPNASLSYTVRFAPTFRLDPYHEGRMVFTFDNGVQETVILRGRDDSPLSALLRIDTNYYARPGDEVMITQRLIAELGLTRTPIRKFTEFIQFDKDVLEFVRIEKASLISSNDWVLKTSQVGGAIDIAISALNDRLEGPGKLLNFVFRVRPEAKEGTVTPITQVTPNFYNDIEPLAQVTDGLVHILDRCDPIIIAGIAHDTSSFIGQNQPNPFNPSTEIPFHVGKEGPVRLELFNSIGERIGVLLDAVLPAGPGKIRLDGSTLPSGVYTYVFTANGKREVRRMQLIK